MAMASSILGLVLCSELLVIGLILIEINLERAVRAPFGLRSGNRS